MKLIGVIFLLLVFISFSHAQDLFDQAEIEFDIDYIDIDKVKVLGGPNKGQVMAVWIKNGSVLTKTLSNSKIKYSDDDYSYDRNQESSFHEVYNFKDNEAVPLLELKGKSIDEIIAMAYEIINKLEWTYNYKWSETHSEELNLTHIMGRLQLDHQAKGPRLVRLGMDIITADLEHGQEARKLDIEARYLKEFAKGDEQLTKEVNDFLTEKALIRKINNEMLFKMVGNRGRSDNRARLFGGL